MINNYEPTILNQDDAPPASKDRADKTRPRAVLALLIGGTVLLLLCVGWSLATVRTTLLVQHARELRVRELTGQIRYLDEVLTMSARMAAATGDLKWEKRYHDHEPQLDQVIKDLIVLSPAIFDGHAG